MPKDEIIAASKERLGDLIEPINGGVGDDVSYDEQFDEIKNEVEKLQSLTGDECNWSSVEMLSSELLSEKSKDFRIACYYATCKLRLGTLEGMLDAMVLLQSFAELWWETMYPPLRRIRARAGMLGWMSDQGGPICQDIKLKPADAELVTVVDELSRDLDTSFREKFGDSYPGISRLREACRHLARTVPKDKPKPEPKPEAPKPAAAAPAPAAQGAAPAAAAAAPRAAPAAAAPAAGGGLPDAGAIVDADTAVKQIGAIGKVLVKMGTVMRQAKPDNPVAWRLSRMGLWLEVTQAPPVNDGKTLVPPPPPNMKQRFDMLVQSDDFLTLLNEADSAAQQFLLWLDPHRYISIAMDRLGALFIKAKKEVLVGTAIYLQRVPAMADLAFNEGTPFADGQTKMWLENDVLPSLGGGGGDSGGGGVASALDEPIAEARGLMGQGKLDEAIGVVAKATATAPTPVDRFRGRLALAQMCLQSGQHEIALPQLEGLSSDIKVHDLTSWDPNLCAEVYGALYTAHKKANDRPPPNPAMPLMPGQQGPAPVPPEDLAAEQYAFDQLCKLDPAQALKLAGKK